MRGQIKQRSKGSYSIIVELPRDPATGKRKQQWTTIKGTRKDAEQELNKALTRLGKGGYTKPAKLTVAAYLEQWLENYARVNVRPRTYERYAEIVRAHLIPALGSILLTSLQAEQVRAYYAKALISGRRRNGTGGLSARTVHHIHRVFFEALRYAVKNDILMRNVCELVQPPRPQFKQMSVTDAEGLHRLLESVKDTVYYPVFYTAAYSGLRRSELLALRWQNVDLDFLTISVTETIHALKSGEYVFCPPKSARGKRAIAVPPSMAIVLREHKAQQAAIRERLGAKLQDSDYVFSDLDGTPLDPGTITRAFRKVANAVGLPKLRFHDLRHTHATLFLQQGVHPKIVSERLGHSSIAITLDTYSHVLPGMQTEAANKFDEVMQAAAAQGKKDRIANG